MTADNINIFANEYVNKARAFYPIIYTDYSNENAFLNIFDKKNIENVKKFYNDQIFAIKKYNFDELNFDDKITYQLLLKDLELGIKSFDYTISDFLPLNQMDSWHLYFPLLGANEHTFNNKEDYLNWLEKINNFTNFLESALFQMQVGIKKGITLQKSLILKVIEQCKQVVNVKLDENPFYIPVTLLPKTLISTQDSTEITKFYTTVITAKVIPAYQKILVFLQTDYLQNAAQDTGLCQFEDGEKYYNFLIELYTEGNLMADELHELGLQDIKEIKAQIDKVVITEELEYFKTEQAVIDYLENILSTVNANLGTLFHLKPKTPLVIKQVEKYREEGVSPHYFSGDLDKNRPGIFYMPIPSPIKISKDDALEALLVHEAIPGHHYQLSLAKENKNITNEFRKNFISTAMCEGWALYTESLGKELGLYKDVREFLGYLKNSMLRAVRLVVDTGLHAKGWTREQAIDFSQKYLEEDITITINSIERYMAIPGQALSYKIGYFKIIALKEKAIKTLGSKFDIKQFHDKILENGTVSLDVLEYNINLWLSNC